MGTLLWKLKKNQYSIVFYVLLLTLFNTAIAGLAVYTLIDDNLIIAFILCITGLLSSFYTLYYIKGVLTNE
jgi:NhaP-type Na+/H+ or K+/H+ antiporter